MDILQNNRKKGIAGIIVIQTNFWSKRIEAFEAGRKQLNKMSNNPEFIAGLMLYWAEGSKTGGTEVANSDVNLIIFMVHWFETFFDIPAQSLVVQMHLHTGQNHQNLRQYWSRVTKIPLVNFQQSYIKPQGTGHRTKKLYSGTIKIRVRGIGSTYLLFQILGAIAEYNSKTLSAEVDILQWNSKPTYAK